MFLLETPHQGNCNKFTEHTFHKMSQNAPQPLVGVHSINPVN